MSDSNLLNFTRNPSIQKTLIDIIKSVLILNTVAIITICIVLTVMIPDVEPKDMEYRSDIEIAWVCPPDERSTDYSARILTYTDSLDMQESRTFRYSSPMQSYADFIDPDNPNIQKIADYLDTVTEGYSDYSKMTAILWFVTDAVDYVRDDMQYNATEYIATPTETLSLGKGDCEDSSILLCSIYRAMGFKSVLLECPNHATVATYLNGIPYLCESTASYPYPHPILGKTDEYVILSDSPPMVKGIHTMMCFLRFGVYDVFGI